jgi:hypothetical protein
MSRRKQTEQEVAGNDSFLDITTNVVGILIILVMVVGERAKTAPLEVAAPAPSRELLAAQTESVQLEKDVHRLAVQMATLQDELRARFAERGQLSTLITAVERDLAERRAELDERSRRRYDLDRDLAIARDELARLEAERRDAEQAAAPKTIKIENFPTPIGKTVDSKEAHFQLLHGRLAVVPYEPLIERLRSSLREQISRLGDQSELVDTLGPVEGFRLRYVLERSDMPGGAYFQVTYIEFVPVSSRLGEPVEEALAQGSAFRRTLEMLSPSQYTITVWTYPDSFAEFLKLKKELYERGYAVAARPLPEGMPIGASPQGTKSSAE